MRTYYAIGPFRLEPDARVLTRDGVATALGSPGVGVLTGLVTRAGEHVEKSVIFEAAWPGLVVEEANVTVRISRYDACFRRCRKKRWIETLAGRGSLRRSCHSTSLGIGNRLRRLASLGAGHIVGRAPIYSCRLFDQRFRGDAKPSVQFPRHRHGQMALAIEHLVHTVRPADVGSYEHARQISPRPERPET